MLDGAVRTGIAPGLDRLGTALARRGVTANQMTVLGFVLGMAAGLSIAAQFYLAGLALILLSRLCDGLDGAVARATAKTDRGGFLDIVLDFAFYGMIPLGFVIAEPGRNAVACATLLFSFYVNGASFLAYAIMAEKHGLTTQARGEKSLYFTSGLAEATETIFVFVLFCLLPEWFAPIAYVFAAMTLITAAGRILLALRVFR